MDPIPKNINNINVVKELVESGADINKLYDAGFSNGILSVLHFNVIGGHMHIVKYLVESSPDLNIDVEDSYGLTPLHYAAYHGYMQIVKYLLENGADKDKKSHNETTADYAAFCRGFMDVREYIRSYECLPVKGVHE